MQFLTTLDQSLNFNFYLLPPFRFSDPEIQAENLAEMKHHKLARARRTGQSEKDLKPNAETRNRLNDIILYPNTQTLSSEEKDLVWQYRFYLSANKKALAKFVKCVDWNTKTEANQALDLVSVYYPPIELNLKNIMGGPSKLFCNYKSSSLNGQSIQFFNSRKTPGSPHLFLQCSHQLVVKDWKFQPFRLLFQKALRKHTLGLPA